MIPTNHLEKLGLNARDKVTGLEGVISSISFDLYGCIQYAIQPPAKDGERRDSWWHDANRVVILSDVPVMDPPDFNEGYVSEGRKGAAEKPTI